MATLYPLRFEPIFRRYLWGGRRLGTVLGKSLGEGDDYAESWEISDHGDDQSVVTHGPLAGQTLHSLVTDHGPALLGRHDPQRQFPLLMKFLDANKTLSLQVHPNDAQARQLDPPDLGKTEAWVVLDAEPGSKIYAGLQPGVDQDTLEKHLRDGNAQQCVNIFEPEVGDCILLEAGTVHAIGAGLLVAEIQQASDTTFRLFDWNRLGTDGKPRQLHIEQSLAVTDFDRGPIGASEPQPTDDPGVVRLAACDKFVLDRVEHSLSRPCCGDERFHILAVIEGTVELTGDPSGELLAKGDTALIPAECGEVAIVPQGRAVLLDMYLP
jgi:mannose-6-phosphate isomerase